MISLAALLIQIAGCTGYGAMVLRLLKVDSEQTWTENLAWSFMLGIGVFGWLLFFIGVPGLFTPLPMVILLGGGLAGLGFLGKPDLGTGETWTPTERLLLAGLAVALTLDGLEGVSPPADADTLAYHFATPRTFLEAGRIFFIPRAVDGAAPLLMQMTYSSILALGGEKGLTLWTMVSGWGVAFALFVMARHHMGRAWALALTLIWLTTPVVLYGGGTGQVEVRNAGFVLMAIGALMRTRETGLMRYTAIAGLAAGLFISTKYTGLMFATACGFGILTLKRWPLQAVVFACMAVLAGFQWYLWNFIHTGDPVFPMLYPLVGGPDYPFWNAEHHSALQNDLFKGERAIPNTPVWMLAYPFLATFATQTAFDSERAGMGPFLFLMLPFALAGFWRFRRHFVIEAWGVPLIVLSVFYMLWFLSGSSQRVRHLVPLYPVALLLFTYFSCRWVNSARTAWPVYAGCLLTLGIQLAGHGASSVNYAKYVFTDETRDAYYTRNVAGYEAAAWINSNLTDKDKVLIVNRSLNFLINRPLYYSHPSNETGIDIRSSANNPEKYQREISNLGVTHILTAQVDDLRPPTKAKLLGDGQWRTLLEKGCATIVGKVPYRSIQSRSFSQSATGGFSQYIIKVKKPGCNNG